MEQMIQIGADGESVKYVTGGILEILDKCYECRYDNATVTKALDVFENAVNVNGTTIHDCIFTMEPTPKKMQTRAGKIAKVIKKLKK